MNAESKMFAGTTSLSRCKETTPGASSSSAPEGELCLAELSQSRLPGNPRVMQKDANSAQSMPCFLQHVAVTSKTKHPAPTADPSPQGTAGASAAEVRGDKMIQVVLDTSLKIFKSHLDAALSNVLPP